MMNRLSLLPVLASLTLWTLCAEAMTDRQTTMRSLNVLVVSGLSRNFPAQQAFERGLKQGLKGAESASNLFYEYMDDPYTGPEFDAVFADYLKVRYRDTPIDIVIGQTLRVEALFYRHPELFRNAEFFRVRDGNAIAKGDGHQMEWVPDHARIVTEALALTGATRLVVVGGEVQGLNQNRVAILRQQLQGHHAELDVQWLMGKPLQQVFKILAGLGSDSLVYYMLQFEDEHGARRTPWELATRISAASSVPMVSPWETLLGSGIIGGRVLSLEKSGLHLGRYLVGEADALPSASDDLHRVMYDQRQLERWGLEPDHPGETIHLLNQQDDFYDRYYWSINLVILAIIVLSGFSFVLWRALKQVKLSRGIIEQERESLAERVEQRTTELQQSRQYLLMLLRASGDGMLVLNRTGKVAMANPAASRMLEWPEPDLVGLMFVGQIYVLDDAEGPESCPVMKTLNDGDEVRCDRQSFSRRRGSVFPVEYVATPVKLESGIDGAVVLFRDITQRRLTEQDVRRRADTDSLTGLYNRGRFYQLLTRLMQSGPPGDSHFALLMLDLDHFKPVNDTWGHPAGDRVLKEVARRMQSLCRSADHLARLGGDEFCILIPEIASSEALERLADRLIEELGRAYTLQNGVEVSVGVSIGIAHRIADDVTAKAIVARADRALYAAKGMGRNTWCLDRPDSHTS